MLVRPGVRLGRYRSSSSAMTIISSPATTTVSSAGFSCTRAPVTNKNKREVGNSAKDLPPDQSRDAFSRP